jgi:hypothetical protein
MKQIRMIRKIRTIFQTIHNTIQKEPYNWIRSDNLYNDTGYWYVVNSYKPLKQKYNQLLLEKEELERKVETISNNSFKMSIENTNSPSFLFTDKATNEELYSYLKENPTASRFIFKKYSANQSFLKELCDPENPIYLNEVAKNLEGIYQVKEEEKNLEFLKEQKSRLNGELEKIKDEIKEAEDQYDSLYENLERLKKEYDTQAMQMSNIRTDKGLEMITSTSNDIIKHFDAILERWNTYFKEHGGATMGMTLNSEDFNHMELLNRNTKAMMEQIRTVEFTSVENLDKIHREMIEKERQLRKEMAEMEEQEKKNAEKSMDGIMATNAKKVIPKVMDDIVQSVGHFKRAPINIEGHKYFNKVGESQVLEPLNDAYRLMDNLNSQIANKERREKQK